MRFMPEKPARLLILFALLLALVAGEWWYRRWHPDLTITTPHYVIQSTATVGQTREIGDVVELLHAEYGKVFAGWPQVQQPHPRLQMKLFKDRPEFRRCNRSVGWAEAFYRKPCCHAYYSVSEVNPYHWMLHEAVHQLNAEVARLDLPQWMDEGLGEYFSTSVLRDGVLELGRIDRNTYPIWWLDDLDLTGDLQKDIAAANIIPLRAIILGQGGPDLNEQFNLYYVHWWGLTHFLFQFDGGKYREAFFRLVREGGTLASFEKNVGPIDRIQAEWYQHLRAQKKSLDSLPVKRPKARERTNAPPAAVIPR